MPNQHDYTDGFNLRNATELLRKAAAATGEVQYTAAECNIVRAAATRYESCKDTGGEDDAALAEFEQARLLFAKQYVRSQRERGTARLARAAGIETHSALYNECMVKYAFDVIDRGLAAGRYATWTAAECRCIESAAAIIALAHDLDSALYHYWGDREYFVWAELQKWSSEWQWQRVAAAMNVGTTSDGFLATPAT